MTLITNMVEFCQNYWLIDQKSIGKLSNLSFFIRLWRKLSCGGFWWRWSSRVWRSSATIIDRLIRNRSIHYRFCHFFVPLWRPLAYSAHPSVCQYSFIDYRFYQLTREMNTNEDWRTHIHAHVNGSLLLFYSIPKLGKCWLTIRRYNKTSTFNTKTVARPNEKKTTADEESQMSLEHFSITQNWERTNCGSVG